MGQGAYIFGCDAARLTQGEKSFFARADPWGFILFARNIENPVQLTTLTRDLRDCVGRNAPILIDQEGGRVQRLKGPYWREWMPAADHVKLAGANAARSMWLRYRLIGAELRAAGIDGNCAPLADIATNETHPILANRCYGTGAVKVAVVARAVADGLIDAGVIPVLKHIPGHGRAVLDSHLTLSKIGVSEKLLRDTDFAPFAVLSDLPIAMTAHIVYSALDAEPATTSSTIVDMIRDDLAFKGLLVTDDISMQALVGTHAQKARAALDAGCDIVLHCNGDLDEMAKIAGVSGRMTVDAQNRADLALSARRLAQDIDIAALEAEQRALLGGSPYV